MTLPLRFYLALADAILILHFLFVAFVVAGLLVIWLGWFWRWNFVRNVWFRISHLAAIGIVALESLAGLVCPLTTWENQLRAAGGESSYGESFVQHWLHRLMFFDLGEFVFTISYLVFFALVALSFWFVPPARRPVCMPDRER